MDPSAPNSDPTTFVKRRRWPWLLIALVALAAMPVALWWAITTPPADYLRLVAIDPVEARSRGLELESRLAALASDLPKPGEWKATVTVAELNGWLAVKLPEAFPDLLPAGVQDPRVLVVAGCATLAASAQVRGVATVVGIDLSPYVTEQHELAIELRGAQAGALPIPIAAVVDRLQRATSTTDLPIRWSATDGRPVLLLEPALWDTEPTQHRQLETIELAEGLVYLAGSTTPVGDP